MADYFVIIKKALSLPFAALFKVNSITYWSNVSKNLITLTNDDDKKNVIIHSKIIQPSNFGRDTIDSPMKWVKRVKKKCNKL